MRWSMMMDSRAPLWLGALVFQLELDTLLWFLGNKTCLWPQDESRHPDLETRRAHISLIFGFVLLQCVTELLLHSVMSDLCKYPSLMCCQCVYILFLSDKLVPHFTLLLQWPHMKLSIIKSSGSSPTRTLQLNLQLFKPLPPPDCCSPLRSNLNAGSNELLHSNCLHSTYHAAPVQSWGTSEDVIMWAESPTWVNVS